MELPPPTPPLIPYHLPLPHHAKPPSVLACLSACFLWRIHFQQPCGPAEAPVDCCLVGWPVWIPGWLAGLGPLFALSSVQWKSGPFSWNHWAYRWRLDGVKNFNTVAVRRVDVLHFVSVCTFSFVDDSTALLLASGCNKNISFIRNCCQIEYLVLSRFPKMLTPKSCSV